MPKNTSTGKTTQKPVLPKKLADLRKTLEDRRKQ